MSVVKQHHGAGFLVQDLEPNEVLTPEDMNDEQRMMMASIREFGEKEVMPQLEEIEKRNIKVIRPLFKKAAELGIFMAEVPEEYGGLGLSVLAIAGMNESRSYLGPMASTVFAHQGIGTLPLINFGTKEQVEKFLDRCMSGEIMAAFALTEPSSASDAMNIKTTAVLSGDGSHYVVNGSKQFITNAGWADLFILFTKIDGVHFTAFLLERDTPGLSVAANEKLLGLQGSSVCGLTLEDVKIPAENLLGEVGKGHKVALCTLNLGRLKMSANCVGYSKKVLAFTVHYAAERTQFGNPLAEFGLIQTKLAEMAARLYAAESMSYRTAGLVYRAVEAMGEELQHSLDAKLKVLTEFSIECAMSKVFASETFHGLSDDALQVHGGYGFSEEYPAAKMYRDSRITRIYEGTSEICRLTTMKGILKRTAGRAVDFLGAIKAVEPNGKEDSSADLGGDLEALRTQVLEFKKLFLYLLGRVLDRYGPEALLDNARQPFLESLANVAIQTYAVESTVLRVLKLQERHGASEVALPEALARLAFERGATKIGQETTETLAALYSGDELRERRAAVAGWLPLPNGRMDLRTRITGELVERNGILPEYRN